jgi:hypothetical protein
MKPRTGILRSKMPNTNRVTGRDMGLQRGRGWVSVLADDLRTAHVNLRGKK